MHHQSDSYFIVANKLQCPRCNTTTKVWAFALPDSTMPFFIRRLSQNGIDQMHLFTDTYHLDKDQTTDQTYWMNHCSECRAQVNDIDLFEQSKTGHGPFGRQPLEGSERLQMQEFNQPFEASSDDKLNFWLLTESSARPPRHALN